MQLVGTRKGNGKLLSCAGQKDFGNCRSCSNNKTQTNWGTTKML